MLPFGPVDAVAFPRARRCRRWGMAWGFRPLRTARSPAWTLFSSASFEAIQSESSGRGRSWRSWVSLQKSGCSSMANLFRRRVVVPTTTSTRPLRKSLALSQMQQLAICTKPSRPLAVPLTRPIGPPTKNCASAAYVNSMTRSWKTKSSSASSSLPKSAPRSW